MSYSYRLSRFAAVGWIAVVCILGSARAGLARDDSADRFFTSGDKSADRLIEEKNSDSSAKHEIASATNQPLSTRVEIILKYPENVVPAREPQKESAENEKENLDLQRVMATAATRQADYAFLQFWASVAGIVLGLISTYLIWTTFRETRRSAEAAEEAVLNTIRAERPFLLPVNARLTPREDRTCIDIRFDLANYGKGIGIFVRHTCEINVPEVEPFRPLKDLMRPISPGADLKHEACMGYFDLPEHIFNLKGTGKIIVSGVIVYQGAFKKRWSASYQFEYVPSAPVDANLVWIDGGWSEYEYDVDEKVKDG